MALAITSQALSAMESTPNSFWVTAVPTVRAKRENGNSTAFLVDCTNNTRSSLVSTRSLRLSGTGGWLCWLPVFGIVEHGSGRYPRDGGRLDRLAIESPVMPISLAAAADLGLGEADMGVQVAY
jgi:hypothetical protein